MHRCKQRVLGDAIEEVIRSAFLLDSSSCGHGVFSDRLVQHLSVSSPLDTLHENDLSGHEGQLQSETRPDDRRPHMQPISDIDERIEDHICSEEALGKNNSSDGGVIQCSLKPLRGMGMRAILEGKNSMLADKDAKIIYLRQRDEVSG